MLGSAVRRASKLPRYCLCICHLISHANVVVIMDPTDKESLGPLRVICVRQVHGFGFKKKISTLLHSVLAHKGHQWLNLKV